MSKDKALKMAIEVMDNIEEPFRKYADEAINACKEALEQPAQEPEYVYINPVTKDAYYLTKVDNTHPHQWQGNKEFVGLTDDEIDNIIDNVFSKSTIKKNGVKTCSVHEGVRAIEQVLKDKNDH